jgi:hypothetical protein
MRFKLESAGDDACHLHEVTVSSSNRFILPVSKKRVVKLLAELLVDPEARDKTDGPMRVERMRDGPRLAIGAGTYTIPYVQVFALVMTDA